MIRQSTLVDQEKYEKDRILHINFNQDQGSFHLSQLKIFILHDNNKDVLLLELKADFEFIIHSL